MKVKVRSNRAVFFIIALIIAGLAYLAFFGLKFNIGGTDYEIKGTQDMRFGIDIRGGVEAVYKPSDPNIKPTQEELNMAKSIFETRLDGKNILDRYITTDVQNGYILLQFPWQSDDIEFNPEKAIAELGETALLTFKDPDGNVIVEGKNVVDAEPEFNQQTSLQDKNNRYTVKLTFDEEGSTKFAEATKRLVGQNISINMDANVFSNPKVESEITGGTAYITGMESMENAKNLADKIKAGALPYSLESSSNNAISPTLGQGALNMMVLAGLIAFIVVCLFMLFYYRLPGFVAVFALALQIVGQLLAISIPQVTLTLAGIAGIILSIGMGVDANVIISERIKEEVRGGKTLQASIDSGFHKAFSSVFDGNITVILVAIVMMIFGSGALLSFAYSLITGVLLNFVAGVTASRLMIKSLGGFKFLQKPWLFGAKKKNKEA